MTSQLDRIEAKLDHILMQLNTQTTTPMPNKIALIEEALSNDAGHLFQNWTVKQHCVLQMILRGASNEDIAKRMKVTVNTAKVHVRTLFRKLDVNTRAECVSKCLIAFREVSDDQYMLMTRGLPKDWDETYSEPDPHDLLIHGATNAA